MVLLSGDCLLYLYIIRYKYDSNMFTSLLLNFSVVFCPVYVNGSGAGECLCFYL